MNVGIIGLGFMGGSLAKSLKKSNKVKKILAYDTNFNSLKNAYNDKVIDGYCVDIDKKFGECDFVFICTPASYISEYAKKLEKIVKRDCIITDMGSTKRNIIDDVKMLDIEFIGAHPMVGSERSGYDTSKELLFENSYYIISKSDKNKDASVEKLKELILEIKAIPIVVNATEHDYITGAISHVPQVVASTLVNMVKDLDDEEQIMKTLAAGGFKDITRIASSDPKMWQDICRENKSEIVKILEIFVNKINSFIDNIDDLDSVYNYFARAKEYRDSFIDKKINGNIMVGLDINIKDENGAIARVATILSNNNVNIKNIEVVNNREDNYGALKVIVENYEEMDRGYDILSANGYEVRKIN